MHTSALVRTAAPSHHVFAYGSLVEPGCLDDVLGRRHTGERLRARLAGYQRITTSDYPFPYIVAAPNRWVEGLVVMDLSSDDLQLLDEYEEIDAGTYRRELVEVEAWGCGPRPMRLRAFTYVAGPGLIAPTNK